MAWTIEYDEGAVKDLKKLDHQVQREILDFLEKRIGQAKHLPCRKLSLPHCTGPRSSRFL